VKIALIACSKSKAPGYCQARDLYTGANFKLSLGYAEGVLKANVVKILSAKYYVLSLNQWVTPYDDTLVGQGVNYRKWWTMQVLKSLDMHGLFSWDRGHIWHLLAGKNYIEYLAPLLPGTVHTPLAGMGIGQQQHWLLEQLGVKEGKPRA
jgi:hypothetical protein